MRFALSTMALLVLSACGSDRVTLGDTLVGVSFELQTVNAQALPRPITTTSLECTQTITIHGGSIEFLDAARAVLRTDVERSGADLPTEREIGIDSLRYSGTPSQIEFRTAPNFAAGFPGTLLHGGATLDLLLPVGGRCGGVLANFAFTRDD